MTEALISLGANTADKEAVLTQVMDAIGHITIITARTPIYTTPAEGSIPAAPYANALLLINTHSNYEALRATFKEWEQKAGRTPQSKAQGIIPLDIDIIMWDGSILKERDMQYEYMKKGLSLLDNCTRF